MKFIEMDDEIAPRICDTPDGNMYFIDCQFWFNLEVGDMIQYRTVLGTSCYRVIDKQPAMANNGMTEGVYKIIFKPAEY